MHKVFLGIMMFPVLIWGAETPQITPAPDTLPDLVEATKPESKETKKSENRLSFNVSASLLSEYTNVVGITLCKVPIATTELGASYKTNFGAIYAGTWDSYKVNMKGRYGQTSGDEIDAWIGWSNTWKNWVSTDLTAYEFDLEGPKGGVGRINNDLFAADLKVGIVGLKRSWFVPYVKTRFAEPLGDKGPEKGWFSWIGFSGSQKTGLYFQSRPVSLNYDVSYGHSWGLFARDPGPIFVQSVVSLPVPVWKHMSITPCLRYLKPIGAQSGSSDDFANKQKPRLIFGLSLNWKF
ncbi:MAG: hypothetical protein PHV42_01420 [Candidatus Pacebacteria bacterium]|nr:hypothetical protein [Candidatus Paceibacterota bacterium]